MPRSAWIMFRAAIYAVIEQPDETDAHDHAGLCPTSWSRAFGAPTDAEADLLVRQLSRDTPPPDPQRQSAGTALHGDKKPHWSGWHRPQAATGVRLSG